MASKVDFNTNTTLSSDSKHHMIMIYHIDGNGYYGGGYYEPFWSLMGGVQGTSREMIIEKAFESLEEYIEDEDSTPFDRKNIKESVVFDVVECYTMEELDKPIDLQYEEKDYEEIKAAVANNIFHFMMQGNNNHAGSVQGNT